MKKRISAAILAFLLTFALVGSACAAEMASDYISQTAAYITSLGNGKISVEFEVVAVDTMDDVGARIISIYEEQSDGSFDMVHVYYKESTWGMVKHDTHAGVGNVFYQGTAGTRYYAVCELFAQDSSGSDTVFHTTSIFTA